MTKSLYLIFFILLSGVFASGARAQDRDDQEPPIRLQSDLVTLTAAVTDRAGRAIKSLRAEDFTIYEDGVKQQIVHFAATRQPFAVMLLLDISGSTSEDIALIKRAAKNFLKQLDEKDRVGVIVFSREVELVADFTDSRAAVEAAIDEIQPTIGGPGRRYSTSTGTSFYDALFLAVDESPLKEIDGRKAIVCMSDGVDSTSKLRYEDVAQAVDRADAVAYFLELNTEAATLSGLLKPRGDAGYINFSASQLNRYYDRYDPKSPARNTPRHDIDGETRRAINAGLYEIARREQREMAERTGGRVYPVSALTDLSAVFSQVADDLRSVYSIGYYPANAEHDGRWRKIRVEVSKPDATVRARAGYYAK